MSNNGPSRGREAGWQPPKPLHTLPYRKWALSALTVYSSSAGGAVLAVAPSAEPKLVSLLRRDEDAMLPRREPPPLKGVPGRRLRRRECGRCCTEDAVLPMLLLLPVRLTGSAPAAAEAEAARCCRVAICCSCMRVCCRSCACGTQGMGHTTRVKSLQFEQPYNC